MQGHAKLNLNSKWCQMGLSRVFWGIGKMTQDVLQGTCGQMLSQGQGSSHGT